MLNIELTFDYDPGQGSRQWSVTATHKHGDREQQTRFGETLNVASQRAIRALLMEIASYDSILAREL